MARHPCFPICAMRRQSRSVDRWGKRAERDTGRHPLGSRRNRLSRRLRVQRPVLGGKAAPRSREVCVALGAAAPEDAAILTSPHN
jgi:hypothetical protein